jgi:hypothetical protein
MVRRIGSLLGLSAVALALTACGSESHTTSSATKPTASAVPATNVAVKLPGTSAGSKPTAGSVGRFPKGLHQVARPKLSGLAGLSLSDKLQTLANTVASFWTLEFRGANVQLTPATVNLIVGSPAQCGSGQLTTTDPPLYCAASESLELPISYIQSNIAPLGDAALALLVSDVYGYHIENVLGELSPAAGLSAVQLAEVDSCFSGTFFYYLEALKALGPGDEAAVNQLLASQPAVSAPQGSGASATADQLTSAFNRGVLSNGNAAVCIRGLSGGGTSSTS